ncbi:MAG: addiction module antitoxin [archaeon GW2011_AR4]|nr:MAG: addiction module antitoxin [archaeon GW2011_AR4]
MYSLEITPQVDKIFSKLSKRYPKQMDIIYKKVEQIIQNPYHFKPLKGDMHGARRVHIGKSFVLRYEINEEKRR